MLALEVTLLTGRYVATAADDRGRAEWPPHPARLFSALAAAHFEAESPAPGALAALGWLEQQGAPHVTAPEASEREVVTVFVPVNDTTVLGSFDDEAAALDAARAEVEQCRAAGGKPLAKAEKDLAKAATRFADAVKKATARFPPGKEPKDDPGRTAALLPEHRTRRSRTFPSAAPRDLDAAPVVRFAWPEATAPADVAAALDALAARVVRLGHSSSLVSVRVAADDVATDDAATWVPLAAGPAAGPTRVLRVPAPGQTDALATAFALAGDAPGRVMPAAFQRYGAAVPRLDVATPASVFGEDWLVLRRVDGPRLPSVRAVDLARTARAALMESFGPGAPEILSGHAPSGEPAVRPHLAFVPLPFVGHEHADGALLGLALVVPRAASDDERRAVYRALAAWEDRWRQGDDDAPRLPIFLERGGELGVRRVEGDAAQSTLRAASWCEPSTRWASATPVALDRNPGDLNARDAAKEAAAFAEAEQILRVACERIGLPAPVEVVVQAAAPLAGGDKTRRFPPYRAGKPPVQRVLVHASLRFASPVRGPILLGAARYLGLGLFRPVSDHA
jgi:CRISPR-associated protein Csb2